ncbi:ATPase family AAA domain-containing protein 5b isoform X2 [Hippocampus comes]|uniref:ATPase family AAA domain-containing protein 5b isoform X2 n=1 Tax=Hippocampus comes TaxID=109280 RepID=UPI00094E7447|nr:PREDICTED: ATPase family AAA domain-containing protein 5-like isoform X2 [Hippocampus comes]
MFRLVMKRDLKHEDGRKRSRCMQTERKMPHLQCEADMLATGDKVPKTSSFLQQSRVSSEQTLHSLLRDIQASNTAFPVQGVFGTLQRKARERVPDSGMTGAKHLDLKKKQDGSEKASKSLRSNIFTEDTANSNLSTKYSVETRPKASRLSRTRRLKQQVANGSGRIIYTDHDETLEIMRKVSSWEDELWTDKYSPQCASELIGNILQVNKLHSWLTMWKRWINCNENRIVEQIKNEEKSRGSICTQDSWDCGDFQGEVGSADNHEKPPWNTMLITGPSGVGKTASVYACAQGLGFKVFEVNSSSQRNGRQLLYQLKEATQSHLVETAGKDPLRPAYFHNYGTRGCSSKRQHLDGGKLPPPKKMAPSSRKQTSGRRGCTGKESPAAVTLTNFFKTKAKADHLCNLSPAETSHDKLKLGPEHQARPQNKKGAMSLILFEEVDVIFEEDVGFLAAVKTFMMTTKRPVVLTTNDSTFRERFSSSLEEVVFKTPSAVNVCSYLQLLCLAEGVKMEIDDVRSLITLARGDVRRCLLQLQLWVKSVQGINVEGEVLRLPQPSAGCTASMLGLHPVSQNHLLNLLKNLSTEPDVNKLVESWRRDVPLLYTNLEMLIPMRSHQQTPVLRSKLAAADINPVRDGFGFRSMMGTGSRLTRRSERCSHSRKTTLHHRTEQGAASVDLKCLNGLADFFDVMSYIDATVATTEALDPVTCTRDFVWTGADIKDGLFDETSEEEVRSHSRERLLEIRATAEALGCRGCWSHMSDVETEAQMRRPELGQTHLTRQPPADPIMCYRRYKMSQAVLSSQHFGLLGNRQAVCVDYLPALRSISRSTRQQEDEPSRCVNYLRSLHLGLSKSTLQLLAQDFSSSNLTA